jgi:hypothetical protein
MSSHVTGLSSFGRKWGNSRCRSGGRRGAAWDEAEQGPCVPSNQATRWRGMIGRCCWQGAIPARSRRREPEVGARLGAGGGVSGFEAAATDRGMGHLVPERSGQPPGGLTNLVCVVTCDSSTPDGSRLSSRRRGDRAGRAIATLRLTAMPACAPIPHPRRAYRGRRAGAGPRTGGARPRQGSIRPARRPGGACPGAAGCGALRGSVDCSCLSAGRGSGGGGRRTGTGAVTHRSGGSSCRAARPRGS